MRTVALLMILAGSAVASHDLTSELQLKALDYFVDHTHPVTGLTRDRARNFGATPDEERYRSSSLAATGFGMAVRANAAARGIADYVATEASLTKALRFVSSELEHRQGWLYHFVDWESGRRFGKSEISTIDTALFIAGALYAGLVFPETELSRLAEALYARLDFVDMLTDGGALPSKRTLSMGWTPELGYLKAQWDSYSEHPILILLGLGHSTKPLPPETWESWSRPVVPSPFGFLFGPDLPLFAHQYTHLFVDLTQVHDSYGNYFQNSRAATLRERWLCREDIRYATYRAGLWGRSAGDSPEGYQAFSPAFHDGTVCPACAGASILFEPSVVRGDLEQWRGDFGEMAWGTYGFADSINLDRQWVAEDVIGITVGALYLAMANSEPHSPWHFFRRYPAMSRALRVVRGVSSFPARNNAH